MPLWGKTAEVALTGTGSIANNAIEITGANTAFTTELSVGDVVTLDTSVFRVTSIASNTSIGVVPAATAAITAESMVYSLTPTYLPVDAIDDAVLVTTSEAQAELGRDVGLKTPGWNLYRTYTDANGSTRHKSESLVVFKS